MTQKYPQYCWEFHDRLWEALSGTTSEKRSAPSRTGGEIILEMLWKPQMPWIIGFGASQPYSRREFQETLWERFRGLSGIFPEFLPESPSRTGGVAQQGAERHRTVILNGRRLLFALVSVAPVENCPMTVSLFNTPDYASNGGPARFGVIWGSDVSWLSLWRLHRECTKKREEKKSNFTKKSVIGPSLAIFKVNNWAKSKSITGPRSFSHYKNRGFRRFFLLSYHCVCFFVPNYLAVF